MRKILLSLVIFLILPLTVLADNNVVTFNVTFGDDVNKDLIENIYVEYTDLTEEEYSTTLKKENNFFYTYDLYDGSDITRVKATFDNNDYSSETSVVKTANGYDLFVHVIKKEDDSQGEIIIDKTTPTTTTQPVTTKNNGQNTQTTTRITNSTSNIYNNITTNISETNDDNKVVKTIFIVVATIVGTVALIFIVDAIIKIVNANK